MNVLIVDDDRAYANDIASHFETIGFPTTIVDGGSKGKKTAVKEHFDFYLIGQLAPGICGIQLCLDVKKRQPAAPVLMLKPENEATIEDKLASFNAGADDYLVRPIDVRELEVRIKVLTNRLEKKGPAIPSNLEEMDLMIDYEARLVKLKGEEVSLTSREFTLLEYFMQNVGKVLSREEIAGKAWYLSHDTGTNLVDVYVNSLRKKIETGGRKFIHTRVGQGYLFHGE